MLFSILLRSNLLHKFQSHFETRLDCPHMIRQLHLALPLPSKLNHEASAVIVFYSAANLLHH